LGGIQPEPMRAIADTMVDDGLIQRFTIVMMAPAAPGVDAPVSDVERRYDTLIDRLFKMEVPFEGWVVFDDAAMRVREQLEQKHLNWTQFSAFSRKFASHVAKYDRMFARLCLLWCCIESAGSEPIAVVKKDIAVRVADFLHKFLLPHAMAFYSSVYGLAEDND